MLGPEVTNETDNVGVISGTLSRRSSGPQWKSTRYSRTDWEKETDSNSKNEED